jgi:hypothetical protein
LFQLKDQAATVWAVDQTIEGSGRGADVTSNAARHVPQRIRHMLVQLLGQIGVERIKAKAEDVTLQSKKRSSVFTGLDDDAIRLSDKQEGSVRLNGAREMDLLAFAIR